MPRTKLNNSQLPDTIQNKTIDTSNDIDTTTAKLTITGGSNGQVLSTDGSGNLSWTTAGGGGVSDGDKGDITVSSSGATWTIDNGVVTYAKMQDVSATNRLLGRATAGAGDVEEITIGSGLSVSGTTLSALGAPTAVITKTTNETVTSSITPQNDNELVYTLSANKRYIWQMFILMSRENLSGTPQMSYQFSTNGTGYFKQLGSGLGYLYTQTKLTLVEDTAAGVPTIMGLYGNILHTSATDLQFQWAQRTSSTTGTTVHAGSRLIIWEVA